MTHRNPLTIAILCLALSATGCGKKDEGNGAKAPVTSKQKAQEPPEESKTEDVTEPTDVPGPPGDKSEYGDYANACCCVSPESPQGDIYLHAKDCATAKKGKCVTWTEDCMAEARDQAVANERMEADDECPSGDRHDCDGDGVKAADDKDDNDPEVK